MTGRAVLTRIPIHQLWYRCRLLLLANLFILLLVGSRLEPLPGKTTTEKVEEYVAQGFEVVSPGLFCRASAGEPKASRSGAKGLQ